MQFPTDRGNVKLVGRSVPGSCSSGHPDATVAARPAIGRRKHEDALEEPSHVGVAGKGRRAGNRQLQPCTDDRIVKR
jgi:hypothetical protein